MLDICLSGGSLYDIIQALVVRMNALINRLVGLEKKCGDILLSTSGSRIQFELCIFLVSIIPLFALSVLAMFDVSMMVRFVVFAVVLPVVLIGYAIVSRYPRAIKILRRDLEGISTGDLPDVIDLKTADADIHAIKESLDGILVNTRKTIAKIREQQDAIVEMERERVMYESIGAACHHMGQPAAVLTHNLQSMRDHGDKVDADELLQECCQATDKIVEVLRKLNTLEEYKTTPYASGKDGAGEDVNILSL